MALGAVDHHLAHAIESLQNALGLLRFLGRGEFPHTQGDAVTTEITLERLGRALGDHTATIEDRQTIRQGIHLFEVVAAEQNRGAVIAQLLQHLPQRSAALNIQTHRGLIQHQHRRAVQQPTG